MDERVFSEGKVLVTGAAGQLGCELKRILPAQDTLLTDVAELDISNRKAVFDFFARNPISVCINAAAYTAVDKAEGDRDAALRINAEGPQYLAEACEQAGALLLHVSTDFVFDGNLKRPYTPDDPVSPLGVYGSTKAEGESRVLQSCRTAAVVRTSWLYSQWGNNFVKTMMRLGREREELGVVSDQTGSPTWARDLAYVLKTLCGAAWTPGDFGIYHYSNSGHTTWYGLASCVMQTAGLPCRVRPIKTEEYPTPARRPAWSVMDCSRLQHRFGLSIPAWQDSVRECVVLLTNTTNDVTTN
jgi:dTDP-4-dehydrorhamnose reductase